MGTKENAHQREPRPPWRVLQPPLAVGGSAGLGWAVYAQLMGRRNVRGLRVQQAFVIRSKSELDKRARIRSNFRLPAVGGLVAEHGIFGSLVPNAGRLASEVMLADQGALNRGRPLLIDAVLSVGVHCGFRHTRRRMMARRTMMRARNVCVLGFRLRCSCSSCCARRCPSGQSQEC